VRIPRAELLASLPPEWPEDLFPAIQAQVRERGAKVVALDDDPTGTQTVHDVPVVMDWSEASLAVALAEPGSVVYVLTNSRSVPLVEAQGMNREIAANLRSASQATGRAFVVVSRSDSTLRGHYPGEVDALARGLQWDLDATLIVPFFLEGGRLTMHGIHYVDEGGWLIPVAETEYARDEAFGYSSSNLCDWVSEKHHGRVNSQDIASISLEDLRRGGPNTVAARLYALRKGRICVADCASYRDMEVLVAGILQAEAAGRRFLYRTAASFVRVRAGLEPRGLLTAADLALGMGQGGGLIIVGSYVQRSTTQLRAAQALPGVVSLELPAEKVLADDSRQAEILRLAAQTNELLSTGQDACIYTSRRLIREADPASALRIGRLVSSALAEIVESLRVAPSWIIAKGGITASDAATQGLNAKRAEVLGQTLPGVPVWRMGQGSRWPGLAYVVFPGNVGDSDALAQLVQLLRDAGTLRAPVLSMAPTSLRKPPCPPL
jgi:uncharacterized protein YgbK (DUF1537 family)